MTTRTGPGRPRLTEPGDDTTTREQLLNAAAALFTEHGFAGATTRMIAESVGIRQASLDRDPDAADNHAVATSCLRLCGLDDAEIDAAQAAVGGPSSAWPESQQ